MTKLNTTNDSDIYLWNAETKALTHLSAHKGDAQFAPAVFDPASKYLYYLTNEGSEFTRLRRYALAGGTHEDVEKADWDITFTSFSHGGRYRVTGVNRDGRAVISVVDTTTGKPVALPAIPNGGVGGVSIARSESKLAFYLNGDRSPNDLHVLQLGVGGDTGEADLVAESRDRCRGSRRYPGGALQGARRRHRAEHPVEAASGHAVGEGAGAGVRARRAWRPDDQRLQRDGAVLRQPRLRRARASTTAAAPATARPSSPPTIASTARSRCGTASTPSVSREPALRRCQAASASWAAATAATWCWRRWRSSRTYSTSASTSSACRTGCARSARFPPGGKRSARRSTRRLGDPVADEKMLYEVSPVFHGAKIRKPLIVLQGANDPRVLKAESDDIVAAVKKNGVPVEYIVFADEGHGFTKKKNQIEGYSAVLKFLDTYLKEKKAGTR